MYSFHSRIRYSEVDATQHLDLHAIINYFQDCSTFHSEDIGLGIEYFEKENLVWVLNSWQIQIHRFPKLCETMKISTWAYDFASMYGYRNFLMQDESGETVAVANSIWVLMDTTTMRPVKVDPLLCEKYVLEEKYPMEYAPRKIKLPASSETKDAFPVIKSNIDTNNHVNNGQYIKMAEEYLPSGFVIKEMRAEYRKSAVLGDIIVPKVHITDTVCTVILAGTDDKPYCIIEFINY